MKEFAIIGVSGAAGAGKDTAASIMQSRYGFGKALFAGPLKAGLCAMFGWDPALLEDREWKERVIPDIGKSPRQLMQTLGTEWGRQLVNPDLWLLLAQRQIEAARANGLPGVVFTDCRFPNEANLIHYHGGVVVRIVRENAGAVAAHSSEAGLPDDLVDGTVFNDGAIDDLRGALDGLLGYLAGV